MAVKIRLARHGAKKRPYYRVVVADSRAPRDGRIIEEVGRYNPMTAPKTINLDLEKIADWQSKGAQLTDAVAALVKAANEGEKTETVVKKSKKQLAKEAEAAKLPLRPLRAPRSKSCLRLTLHSSRVRQCSQIASPISSNISLFRSSTTRIRES